MRMTSPDRRNHTKPHLVAVISISMTLAAISFSPLNAIAQEQRGTEIDSYLANLVDSTPVPGVVAMVSRRDEVLYAGAFGHQDVANKLGMQLNSIFRIASMTKPITSAGVLILVDEGRISLDDPISSYFPLYGAKQVITAFDFDSGGMATRPAGRDITIRHLLTNTSGLGYSFSNEMLRQLEISGLDTDPETVPLVADPGTRWVYGSSTRVLGYLIEELTGVSLESFLKSRIFEPLGMHETSFYVSASLMPRVATVHSTAAGQLLEIPNQGSIASPENGDGGLTSTAGDYTKFIQMFLNGGLSSSGERILSEHSVNLMAQNHIGDIYVETQAAANPALVRPFPLGAGRDKFGLGFQITGAHDDDDQRSPGSLSWAGVYNTEFWIDPERGIGAVLLMQYLPFYDAAAIEGLRNFERLVYEQF